MTKIIRILMALVLIFQILVPIKTVAATTNVNSTEEATSSALTNAKTTSSDNDASQTASEQAKTEPIEKNSNQLESVEESSNTKTKTESSNTEAINVDFSMKPIADSVLAGNVASFENILRVTGPNTVVKNMTLTYKIEGLETGKVTFDASKEVLEKLSIDGVMPSYNQESSTLTYQFKELHTGIAYKNNLEIDSNIGYIKEQQVKIVGQLEIDSETKSEKEATVLIKGTTNVALKQDHEGINLKDSDNIVWTLNLHALKKKGIIFLKENSELIIEQKIPDGLIYQSDNANGSYDAAKKIVVFKVPTPSIAMQEHTILDNDYFSDMPTIKINTKVSKKFSGEKTFETSATVSGENVTEGADHTFSFESNKEKVTVYGTVTPSIPDGVGSEGAPFHRGPAKSNISYEEANYTWTINPSASLQIYPGDSVIFNTNTNFFNATSKTKRMKQLRTSYTPSSKLSFEGMELKLVARLQDKAVPYTPDQYANPKLTYTLGLTVNGVYIDYAQTKPELLKNIASDKKLSLTRESLGLKESDKVTKFDFRINNAEPLTLMSIQLKFKANEDAVGQAVNHYWGFAQGYNTKGEVVSKKFENTDSKEYYGDRSITIKSNKDKKIEVVDNAITYTKETGGAVKAGDNYVKAHILTSKDQPPFNKAVSYVLLPIGSLWNQDKELKPDVPTNLSPSVTKITDNYNNTGRQLLKIDWGGDILANKNVSLQIPITVSENSPSVLTPKIYTYGENTNIQILSTTQELSNGTVVETNEDLMNADYPKEHVRIKSENDYYLTNNNNLIVDKVIKTANDKSFSRESIAFSGEKVQYKITIKNMTNKDFQRLALLDVLPAIDDIGITDNSIRGSQFSLELTGPIIVPDSWKDSVKIMYSESKNPKRANILYNKVKPSDITQPQESTTAEDATWIETPSDYTKIKSVKLELKEGHEFLSHENIALLFNMKAPDYALAASKATNELVAWNSVAVVADGLPVVEPYKVGLKLLQSEGQLEATKQVFDTNNEAIDHQEVQVGDTINYRIKAKNKGTENTIINKVKIGDAIPAGLVYQPGSLKVTGVDGKEKALTDDAVTGQKLATGDLGSLKGGESLFISFKVKVSAEAKGKVVNVATVDGNVPPPTPGEPDVPLVPEKPTTDINVPPGQVSGEKLVNNKTKATAHVGDTLNYSIKLTHEAGSGPWVGQVVDKLPNHVSYVPNSTTIDGKAVADKGIWNEQTLTVKELRLTNETATAVIAFKVKLESESVGTTVVNKAVATPKDPDDNPPVPDIPSVPTVVVPTAGKLKAEKNVFNASNDAIDHKAVKVGAVISYQIKATNTSAPTTIINKVKIGDAIPAGLVYQPGSLKVTGVDGKEKALADDAVTGQKLATGDLGSLKGGESLFISFKVKVSAEAKGKVVNVATVDGNVPPPTPGEPDVPLVPEKPTTDINVPPGQVSGEKLVNNKTKATAHVGDTLNYSIKLTHEAGSGPWVGQVVDKLPNHVSYVPNSTTIDGKAVADKGIWNEQTLTVKELRLTNETATAVIAFKVKLESESVGTTVVNKAVATPKDPDDNPPVPDIPSVPTVVVPTAGKLKAEKNVFNASNDAIDHKAVKVGAVISYQIKATNTSAPTTIINKVKIGDAIPAGLVYQPGSLKVTGVDGKEKALADDAVTGQKLATGDLGSLKGGESLFISFKVKVSAEAKGKVVNVATVDGNVPPPTPGEPDVPLVPEKPTTDINVPPGQVSGEKLVNNKTKATAHVGDTLNYSIKLTHEAGSGPWVGQVVDKLPNHVSYVPNSTTIDGKVVADKGIWNEQTLTVKELRLTNETATAVIAFKVKVKEEALNTTVVNKAVATPKDPDDNPPVPDIPSVPTVVVPTAGKLKAEKNVFNASNDAIDHKAVKVGAVISYQIKATNTSAPTTIINKVKIGDAIPAGLVYQPGSLKVTGVDGKEKALADDAVTGQKLATGDLGSLKGGESLFISFKVKVSAEAKGKVVNVATVDGNVPPPTPGEPDVPLVPEKPTTDINVPPGQVSGEKLVNNKTKATAHVGDILNYSIKLTHEAGSGPWVGQVVDKLPNHVSYVPNSTTIDGKAVADKGIWNEQTLTVKELRLTNETATAVIAFKVKLESESVGTTVVNKAVATPKDPDDNPPVPDIPSVPTVVVPTAGKLKAEKNVFNASNDAIDHKAVKVGAVISYQIKATNTSAPTTIINKVKIGDAIPAGLVYQRGSLKVTGVDGKEKALTDDVVTGQKLATGDLGSLKGGESLFISFKVKVSAEAKGKVVNVATVDGNVPPPTPGEPDVPLVPEKPTTDINVPPGQVNGEKLVNNKTKATAHVGDTLNYSIKLTHEAGSGPWVGQVVDKLPNHVSYVPNSTTIDGKVVADKGIWNEQTLTVKELRLTNETATAVIAFKVKVKEEALNTTVVNKAVATPKDPDDNPPVPDIPSVPTVVVPTAGKLKAEKNVFNASNDAIDHKAVKVGAVISYQIKATNTSAPTTIINKVEIGDAIPAGLVYQPGSLKVTGVDGKEKALTDDAVTGQKLATGDLGSLKGGESLFISFKVKVSAEAKGKVVNVATVDGNVPPPTPGEPDVPLVPEKPTTDINVPPGQVSGEKLVNNKTKATAHVGDILNYSIKLTHEAGSGPWVGQVVDKLPNHVSYVPNSTTIDGKAVADKEIWNEQTLTVKELRLTNETATAVIAFKVKLESESVGTTVVNKAVATPKDPDDNPPVPDIPSVPTVVVPTAGKLKAEKNVFNASNDAIDHKAVKVGAVISYQIKATNTSAPTTIINKVKIGDAIPAGLVYQPGSLKVTGVDGKEKALADDAVTGQKLATGDLGSLKGGESLFISFKVKVSAEAKGKVVNVATVDGNVPPPTPGEPDVPLVPEKPTTDINVPPGQVSGEKLVNNKTKATAHVGDTLNYSIKLTHEAGSGPWVGQVVDKLPNHVSYVPNSTTIDGKAVADKGIWNEQTLTVKELRLTNETATAVIAFKVKVKEEALNTTVVNKAVATPKDPDDNPPVPDIPSVPTVVVPTAGKLKAEKNVFNASNDAIDHKAVKVGAVISYQIKATNTSAPTTIINKVKIGDAIPAGLVYQPGSLKVTGVDGKEKALADDAVTGQKLATGDLGSLKGGESLFISFKVKVSAEAKGKVVNVATVDGNVPPPTPGEPDVPLVPEKPTTDINVPPGQVSGEKLVNNKTKATAHVGDTLNYSIKLTHEAGSGPWVGQVVDKLPNHVSFVPNSTTIDGKAVADKGIWNEQTLTVKELRLTNETATAVIAFKVKVKEEALNTTVVNKAVATPKDPDDNPPVPDIPSVPTVVVPTAGKLKAEKNVFNASNDAIDHKAVKVGAVISYQIKATNTSAPTTIINKVEIGDAIPAGLVYQPGSLKVTGVDGKEKALTDDVVTGQKLATGDLGSLKGGESLFISFKVKVSAEAKGKVVNVATVDGNVPPPTPGEPDVPLVPEKPTTDINVPEIEVPNTPPNKPNITVPEKPSVSKKITILPKTGDKAENNELGIGMILLVLTTLIIVRRKEVFNK